jgi:hypothetical protein
MAEEGLDGTDVLGHLFREGQRVTHQPRDVLASRSVEALDVIVLRACFVMAWC